MSTSCYTGQCVVVFGTASLQKYVFQSNRLKENVGASYLAAHWLGKGLVCATQADTTGWDQYLTDHEIDMLENPVNKDKAVNLIYIGGGNAALLCQNEDIAKEIITTWSRKVLKQAPGLRVVVGYGTVKSSLAKAYRKALNNLGCCEEALPFGSTLYSLPVVRTCISTGQPASKRRVGENNRDDELISQSAACKQDAAGTEKSPGPAQDYIKEMFPSVLEKTEHLSDLTRFALKLDEELGGRKGESHIAIVHADGNGMGELLNRVIDKDVPEDNEFLHNLRAFSASTTVLSHRVLEETLLHFKEFLPLKDSLHNSPKIFPLRPIVFGGDDLTFVCDGRVGLHLASFYLKAFSNRSIKVCGNDESVDACAGVAIVPTKFPFARAYDFADELCGLAKRHRREQGKSKGSWLDFQIIQGGVTSSIETLRDAQYRSLEGQTLHQRPYEVPKAWNDCINVLNQFKSKWHRSRAKGLLQALTQGPIPTEFVVKAAQWRKTPLPYVKGMDATAKKRGWTGGGRTPFFDPLEILDFYLDELLLKENGDLTEEDTV